MKLQIGGVGIWSTGILDWREFERVRQAGYVLPEAEKVAPQADIVPARDKRRVPVIARMAIEAGLQACRMAKAEPENIATVFASCMSDNESTDYLCRVVVSPEQAMSPTKFHNSVHNATLGYWSIYTRNHQSGCFVGAYRESFAAALLESAVLCLSGNQAVLCVVYDLAVGDPIRSATLTDESLACGVVLCPDDGSSDGRGLVLSVKDRSGTEVYAKGPLFSHKGSFNPVADSLALLDAVANKEACSLTYKVGSGSVLSLDIAPGKSLLA
jgi:hypothetical protein